MPGDNGREPTIYRLDDLAELASKPLFLVCALLVGCAHSPSPGEPSGGPSGSSTSTVPAQAKPAPLSAGAAAPTIATAEPTPPRPPDGMVWVPRARVEVGRIPGWPQANYIPRSDVSGFFLDTTETTVAQYRECVTSGSCTPPPHSGGLCNALTDSARANHPVNCVTRTQAEQFCKSDGKRLPTKEEWQSAAMGGESKRHPWGEESPTEMYIDPERPVTGGARDWLCWDGGKLRFGKHWTPPAKYGHGTCQVGLFPEGASHCGALDLAGNVWEWTSSNAGTTTPYPVMCGGGWRTYEAFTQDAREPNFLVGACTSMDDDFASDDIGFRCAQGAPGTDAPEQLAP